VGGAGRAARVPAELGVEVGVWVDETRRDPAAARVDLLVAAIVDPAHGDDSSAIDGHVAGDRRLSGAIDEETPAQDEIVHDV